MPPPSVGLSFASAESGSPRSKSWKIEPPPPSRSDKPRHPVMTYLSTTPARPRLEIRASIVFRLVSLRLVFFYLTGGVLSSPFHLTPLPRARGEGRKGSRSQGWRHFPPFQAVRRTPLRSPHHGHEGSRYQECPMAPVLHASTQGSGGLSRNGLQGAQRYLSLFLRSSLTDATGPSRKGSTGSWPVSNTWHGQAVTQAPQPSHFSVSMLMKKSPEPSLYP